MRRKKGQYKLNWKLQQEEFFNYFSHYASYFNKLENTFSEPIANKLIPLYLEIFGSHLKAFVETLGFLDETHYLLKQDYQHFYYFAKSKSNIKNEQVLFIKCKEFIDEFFQTLVKYRIYDERYSNLANMWMARSLFTAIIMGHPQLVIPPSIISAGFTEDLLNELWKDTLPQDWIDAEILRFDQIGADEDSIKRYIEKPFRPYVLPPAKKFQFATYDVFIDVKEYEEMVIRAYRDHIKAYLKDIQTILKKHGWKRNKSEDYERVRWLVLWNKFDFTYLWEIIDPIENYCDESVKVETVRKAFNKFKKLGLPVKPFGKGGKITTS